jgi:serine/threonine protein kinase
MGEVYRARDPRLGREVAIKVLPAERLSDETRRRRFVQEARAASSLNHPNIVTIHEAWPLFRFDTASAKHGRLGVLTNVNMGLTVSPDGKTIVYSRENLAGADLMMVENFR